MKISVDNILKKFLFLFLILIPFQGLPQTIFNTKNESLSWLRIINYSDEFVFFGSFAILITFILFRPSSYKAIQFPWDRFLFLFIILAAFSMFINKVPFIQGIFGIYDVLKNIIVVYLFSLLHFSKEEFLKIIKYLGRLAFLLAIIGIIGEILAILLKFGIGYLVMEERRLGFFRIISLVGDGNFNYFGVYLVLFFFLGMMSIDKLSKKVIYLPSLFIALFFTLSRQAWIGFGIIFMSMKKKLIPLGIILFILVSITFLSNLSQYTPTLYYRSFTLNESVKYFRQNPVIGIGPGMFGGLSSVLFKSPYYNDWPEFFREMIYRIRNIDMFWPWILAEFGILGIVSYFLIWITLFLWLKKIIEFYRKIEEIHLANIGSILQYFILALMIMGFAGGLNSAFVVFIYFAITGMYFSVYLRKKNEDFTG